MDSVESRGSGRLPAEFLGQSQPRTRAPRSPLYQISSRLSASRSLLQRHSKHRSPRRRSFCAYKRNQNTVKGDSFPLDEPLSVACSAGYERCKSIVRTAHRCAPKVAAGAFAPTALRCPKISSRCSLARFFRPLRVLRLAASATGGARLRTPYPSPVAGEGPSGQITACSNFRLGSVTLCGTTTRKNIVPHPRTATPSFLKNRTINPSCNFPAKSDICAIFAQYLPIM